MFRIVVSLSGRAAFFARVLPADFVGEFVSLFVGGRCGDDVFPVFQCDVVFPVFQCDVVNDVVNIGESLVDAFQFLSVEENLWLANVGIDRDARDAAFAVGVFETLLLEFIFSFSDSCGAFLRV